ncbi:glycoside hydrolase family 95 protein [Karstenula rhodostoma CBS 690.94]|uniref:Glycoside hydrolase family 95 protein n=1 Tax=Karstenula rhodostoma CBS 690.94 TaxID=1392251 RepID=A0A9P4UHU9_9PLEO|nr:glycoside hydrolase family 95 protein [Karstenula rhodostoma CBS 690.94]
MLRYHDPAHKSDWESALPIGNGRLGAMVYGGVHTETLRLNEESVWYGGPQSRTPKSAAHLPRLRELIRKREHAEVEKLVRKRFLARPRSARHYEPLSQCYLEFEHGEEFGGYERTLDLENAQVKVEYKVGENHVRRSYIASFPDSVIAIHVEAEQPVRFSVNLSRMSDKWYETNEFLDSIVVREGMVVLHATPGGENSNKLCMVAGVHCQDAAGTVEIVGASLEITSTDALIVLGASTSYEPDINLEQTAIRRVSQALQYSPGALWARHRSDWQDIYGKQSLQLRSRSDDNNNNSKPTPERLKDPNDVGIIALYQAYGRYLLLSSSRNTDRALPPTLQGIWNPYFSPPWGAKYTININLQMNYWPVNTGNLSECHMPLFTLLHRLAISGKDTARDMYGCRGWCCHHNTDIWADTAPQDEWMPATLWPLGGAWLCVHIWERFLFDEDIEFLKWMIPVLQGCVEFLLDFLIEDEKGEWLVTSPSLSPENTFVDGKGRRGILCEGSTMDIAIVRDVFNGFLNSFRKLRVPQALQGLAAKVRTAIPRLLPPTISPMEGTIREWGFNAYTDAEPGHRHVSHLYALYPGSSITPSSTPTLAAAALATLEHRISHGGGHTGWSRAWLICFFARLRKPVQCLENIRALLRDSTVPNMMDSHPPVQLDGNWGGCAGILECLVQSHEMAGVEFGEVEGG